MISRTQRNSLQNRCGHFALAILLAAGTLAAQAMAAPADVGGPIFAQPDQAGVTGNAASLASPQTGAAHQTHVKVNFKLNN